MARSSSTKGRENAKSRKVETRPLPSGKKRVRAATVDPLDGEYFAEQLPLPTPLERRGASPWGLPVSERDHYPELPELPEIADVPSTPYAQSVPKSLVKFIIGLFLLPPAWVLTETFLQAFTTSLKHGLLASQSFGCFAAGMVLFGILLLLIPQKTLMVPYVLGHEVTHALWVWIFGGKVADHFHVSHEGGHVMTDRVNTWIILAPYFFPIYSLLVVTLYGAASLAADLSPYRWVLFLLLGFTLAFHLVFTCLLIVKGQPDLHYGGTFFSLMVIYLINLLLITGLLLLTSHQVTLATFIRDFGQNSVHFFFSCRAMTEWVIAWVRELITAIQAS